MWNVFAIEKSQLKSLTLFKVKFSKGYFDLKIETDSDSFKNIQISSTAKLSLFTLVSIRPHLMVRFKKAISLEKSGQ